MHPSLTTVQRIDELESLLAESEKRPLLLFKHSRSCGISAEALDELIEHLNSRLEAAAHEASAHHPRYAVVTVQTHREVSNAVAAKLGVRHETPQAIIVRGGKAVWSASHFRVNAASIQKALTAS
jgi:bacillithiol system protein YtxJ